MSGAILVVEDELVTQKLIAVNLERAGHKVMRAANVPEAVAAIREVLPDLVLLDWILPNATGVSFARQLRSDQRTRDIPIIMLTGRAQETDKVTGLEAGADDYITKPFSPRELLARIKAGIRRRAREAQFGRPEETQKASGFLSKTKIVFTTICKSSCRDQFRRYSRSCSMRPCILSSVSVSPRKPLTCAKPVIPGLTLCRIM